MKISLLVSSLSTNVLTRAAPIASVLSRFADVEVIGPVSREGIYPPYSGAFDFVRCEIGLGGPRRYRALLEGVVRPGRSATGDVVYAFKPKLTSFGSGILAKMEKRRPLVLDIDDWDAEPYYSATWRARMGRLRRLYDPDYCWWYARGLELLVGLADAKTVASSGLQRRYGGTRLPQIVDCGVFDPDSHDGVRARAAWGGADRRVILFTGNALPHKGLGVLAEALGLLGRRDVVVWVVGSRTAYLEEVMEKAGGRIVHVPLQPHSNMPELLSLAEMVVLPQLDVAYARMQVPAKLVEAMAMAKPVIASAVSDIPDILAGCGWVVPPGDADSLADAIGEILDDADRASERGRRAREVCLRDHSHEAAEVVLAPLFSGLSAC